MIENTPLNEKPTDTDEMNGDVMKKPRGARAIIRRYHFRWPVFMASLLAILAGICGGFAGMFIHDMISWGQVFLLGFKDTQLAPSDFAPIWWQVLLAPIIGGLCVGLIYYYFIDSQRPEGMPDVMIAGSDAKTPVTFKEALKHAPLHILSVSCGASSGREGPAVHLASGFSHAIAHFFKLEDQLRLILLGCAVAAAVASSFNAPLAGVFFALELVIGNYALASFLPVVLAAVTGTLISRARYGDVPAFDITGFPITSFYEVPSFMLLGLFAALLASTIIRGTWLVRLFHNHANTHPALRPMMAGLCLGLMGIIFPQILGLGYGLTVSALELHIPILLLISLLLTKIIATILTLGSGFGGGVFSPSLVIGALGGALFGSIFSLIFPAMSSGVGAYAIIGMGAVAGAVLGAPISTILIIFEMTGDYRLMIAVMIATVISSQLTLYIAGDSFFSRQLKDRGIAIRHNFHAKKEKL